MTWRANEDLELLELIAGRSCILSCTSSMYTADRNMYGRGSTNSMIVIRPRHVPSPFDPPTRTAQALSRETDRHGGRSGTLVEPRDAAGRAVTCNTHGGRGESLVPNASLYMRKRPFFLSPVGSATTTQFRDPPADLAAAATVQGSTLRTGSLRVRSYGLGFMQTLLIIP